MKFLFIFSLISLLLPVWAQSGDYPGRATYPKVQVYETSQLNREFDNVIVVDVRSAFEFNTLHINNAINIPLNSKKFTAQVSALQNDGKPVIFYCNGHSCYKSYKAAKKARRAKITNIFAYDSGIFDWAKAHPEKAVLLGSTPVDTSRLLSKDDLKKYLLKPEEFTANIDDNTVILDIREPSQRGLIELFPYRQDNISMDEQKKLSKFLKGVKKSGKSLLVYDEAGKQVRWLQYYLEDNGIADYFFMAGGVKQFFKSLTN
ncbi:MAG: rhodanese-like domain-containing protein [Gammaproteobacteria bacterium]|jgi:rhodanese-related sulfurtransferase|nr:rhodanese-like domain-containing protein [Gammaproteobacteria bacterium]MBT3725969.1 rhodanese-like domain-containing protein [Gammaproteobacteria bacterium]MBT4078856.1 rhodanese-like domain-containing protein [Gammaproteobacteria bacterium]MBT4193141.1 rhodanese-like domain-containing protein [Gammaproteobacteria bacterium]MBT4450276.1 rhodanese-like domain-containing protein [Gammaproteobacteria bacterium]